MRSAGTVSGGDGVAIPTASTPQSETGVSEQVFQSAASRSCGQLQSPRIHGVFFKFKRAAGITEPLRSSTSLCHATGRPQDLSWGQKLKISFLSHLGVKPENRLYLTQHLTFFPLRFSDPVIEQQFFEINHLLYPMRMLLFGAGCLFINIMLWIYVSFNIEVVNLDIVGNQDHYLIFHSSQRLMFHVMQAIVCVCYILVLMSPWIPGIRQNLELSSLIILAISSSGLVMFAVFGALQLPEATKISGKPNALDLTLLVAVADFSSWSASFIDLGAFGLILSIDLFFPSRTRFSILFHLLIIGLCGGVRIASAAVLEQRLNQATPAVRLQIFVLCCVVLSSYSGRYMIELCDRAAAYELIQSRGRVELLEREIRDVGEKQTRSSTAVEDLITLVKQSLAHLASAEAGYPEGCRNAEEFMHQALKVLTRTDNLYTVRFASSGGEVNDINRRFLELYAGVCAPEGRNPTVGAAPRSTTEDCLPAAGNPLITASSSGNSLQSPLRSPTSTSHASHTVSLASPHTQRSGLYSPSQKRENTNGWRRASSSSPTPGMETTRHLPTDPASRGRGFRHPTRQIEDTVHQIAAVLSSAERPPPCDVVERSLSPHSRNDTVASTKDIFSSTVLPPLIPSSCRPWETSVGCDWDLDMLALKQTTPNLLQEVGRLMLNRYKHNLWIADDALEHFLLDLETLYYENPYHNAIHAATVGHLTGVLMNWLEIGTSNTVATDADLAAALIASFAHDVGHPARNNAFFINTYNSLTVLYNDRSPLENYHCCLLFRLLQKQTSNVFANVDSDTYRTCRKNMISLILGTDMKSHFEAVSLFRIRRSAPDFNYATNKEDFWLTLHMVIKTADLGHAAMQWDQHVQWSGCVVAEFYQQGDEEAALGFPVSPLCDQAKHNEYAKSQQGFIEFVVQPIFREMADVDQKGKIQEQCIQRLTANWEKWKAIAQMNCLVPVPSHSPDMLAGTRSKYMISLLQMTVFKDVADLVASGTMGETTMTIAGRKASASTRSSRGVTCGSQELQLYRSGPSESPALPGFLENDTHHARRRASHHLSHASSTSSIPLPRRRGDTSFQAPSSPVPSPVCSLTMPFASIPHGADSPGRGKAHGAPKSSEPKEPMGASGCTLEVSAIGALSSSAPPARSPTTTTTTCSSAGDDTTPQATPDTFCGVNAALMMTPDGIRRSPDLLHSGIVHPHDGILPASLSESTAPFGSGRHSMTSEGLFLTPLFNFYDTPQTASTGAMTSKVHHGTESSLSHAMTGMQLFSHSTEFQEDIESPSGGARRQASLPFFHSSLSYPCARTNTSITSSWCPTSPTAKFLESHLCTLEEIP